MKNKKMRCANFSYMIEQELRNNSSDNIDLEVELNKRGLIVASHGRIDWSTVKKMRQYMVGDSLQAARTIIKIINDFKLAGSALVVWSDACIKPMQLDTTMVCKFASEICEEDWDCWIISSTENWVIEKYHEGEVCIAHGQEKVV